MERNDQKKVVVFNLENTRVHFVPTEDSSRNGGIWMFLSMKRRAEKKKPRAEETIPKPNHLPCFVSLDFINTTRANRKFIYYMSRNYNALSAFVDEMNNLCTMEKFISDLNCDPNINYDRLDSIIQNSLNKHLPIKLTRFRKYRHKKEKWITGGILNSKKFRDKLYAKVKATALNNPLYNTLKVNLTTYNRILRQNIRLAKKTYYNSQFDKYKNDIKKISLSLKVRGEKCQIP